MSICPFEALLDDVGWTSLVQSSFQTLPNNVGPTLLGKIDWFGPLPNELSCLTSSFSPSSAPPQPPNPNVDEKDVTDTTITISLTEASQENGKVM